MSSCQICHRVSDEISAALGLCPSCITADTAAAQLRAAGAHRRSREKFGLPNSPPHAESGIRCGHCANACRIDDGRAGYCGIRRAVKGGLIGGDSSGAAVTWYRDPLPTNCVADWVCPASTAAGYPEFTDTKEVEHGYHNLAVFYEACSFDCLFCQNWHFRERSSGETLRSDEELADAVNDRTRCICLFGGDPSCQIEHALASAQKAQDRNTGKILRICWETNGSVIYPFCPVDEFPAVHEPVAAALARLPAFDVSLADFDTFRHRRGNHTVWLRPEPQEPLIALQGALSKAYLGERSSGQENRFQPHLSVGQVQGAEEMKRLVEELQAPWKPLTFKVDRVSLIWRRDPPDDVFRVADEILLK